MMARCLPSPRPSGPSAICGAQPPGAAYIPFGLAPRVCLSRPLAELELRLLTLRLLQTLRFSPEPDQDLSLDMIPTPRPRSGVLVRAAAKHSAP